MNNRAQPIVSTQRQDGVALIVGLLVLIIFAILGVSAMNTTLLQERMAGSFQGSVMAFNASESALRAGETWLLDLECPPPDPSSSDRMWDMQGLDADHASGQIQSFWYDHAWPTGVGATPAFDFAAVTGSTLSSNPRYVIEELPPLSSAVAEAHGGIAGTGDVSYTRYRITARGTGPTGNEYVLTQSTFVLDCIS
ncbi:MAG: hypothetical protein DHS20C11_13100 [Lysobacteraceae bacterium]|nr:MAG: hypothetical protein DHS20C11_13100 [Xanthomonadaceae bacterium]